MKKAFLLFGTMLVLTVMGCDHKPKEFVNPAAGFSVMMPGTPKNEILSSGANTYHIKKGINLYLLVYWHGDREPDLGKYDQKSLSARGNYKENFEKVEQPDGTPGEQNTLEIPDQGIKTIYRQFYLTNQTFRVMVTYEENKLPLMDPQEFLDSFRLTD